MGIMLSIDPNPFCITIPESAFTIPGFEAWLESGACPEHGRFEFLDGEVCVDMSPERAESHSLVKGEIYHVLTGVVRERNLGMIFPDGVTFTNDAVEDRKFKPRLRAASEYKRYINAVQGAPRRGDFKLHRPQ